jgi:hypothetical protein
MAREVMIPAGRSELRRVYRGTEERFGSSVVFDTQDTEDAEPSSVPRMQACVPLGEGLHPILLNQTGINPWRRPVLWHILRVGSEG